VRADLPVDLANSVAVSLGELAERRFTERLWSRDATVWRNDPDHQRLNSGALGWLDVAAEIRPHVAEVVEFVD